jgi:hypothetical protein
MDLAQLLAEPIIRGGIALAVAVLLAFLASRRWGADRNADRATDTGLD